MLWMDGLREPRWERGALMRPATQNLIFSNLQHFNRCYMWCWHVLLIRINLEVISGCLAKKSASTQSENTSGTPGNSDGENGWEKHNTKCDNLYCSQEEKSSSLFRRYTDSLEVMEMVMIECLAPGHKLHAFMPNGCYNQLPPRCSTRNHKNLIRN